MKPVSLCLVQMGKKGLELVEAYPRALPEDVYNLVVIKCMPLGAKEGEFTTINIGEYNFSGYVFTIPSTTTRSNIASLVAVFDSVQSNPEMIKKVFAFTVNELRKNNLINLETLTGILPKLYKGINEEYLEIKISSIVTLQFDFKNNKERDPLEEATRDLRRDMWSK